ncbi:hypothetical protein Cgig2_029125 [Carnegiea gigantea]|uniref:Uncharacterized protein n=1 Tax=Carnegiea gigantea TaxID=171969 RepID=A0A9Q1QKH6_9CARY|nr:hypothetical protein Cgig2_029125 [Carnegiea gigantea]
MSSNVTTTTAAGGGGSSVSRKSETWPMSSSSLFDELRSFDKGGFFDLGHPLLNRIAHSFITAAGVGAVQAVSREAYFTAVEVAFSSISFFCLTVCVDDKYLQISSYCGRSLVIHLFMMPCAGETSRTSVEALVKNTGKESVQWGLAAGVYSGLTYGMKEARGCHDWKNSAIAGALAGVTIALTSDDTTHERVVHSAITGAALATAANLLAGIF